MPLDPSIILAGQAPQVVNALAGGAQAAGLANAVGKQNALDNLYRTQGAGILSGDQNALNALAGLDPQAALGVKQTQQGMSVQLQQLQLAKDAGARAAQELALRMDAASAAKEAERIGQGMNAAAMAQTPDQWNQVLSQYGIDPATHPFEQRDAILAGYLGAKDVLEMRAKQQGEQPTFRPATPEEAQKYGSLTGQIDVKTGRFYPNNPPSTLSVTSDGQGGFSVTQGSGAGAKPLTVEEGKNSGYLLRAESAEGVLQGLEAQGASLGGRFLENIPGGLGNYLQSPEYRQYEQARRNFVNAILRRESGAVISDQEFANAERQYFPVPGDDPKTIEQKRQNRADAIAGLRIGSGAGAQQVDAVRNAGGSESEAIPSAPPQSFLDREDVKSSGVDPQTIWDSIPEDQKRKFLGAK